jgi:hypothetical protein
MKYLSFHADHEHTTMTQWALELTIDTKIECNDTKSTLTVSDGVESVIIQFEKRNLDEYPVWKDALLQSVDKFNLVQEEEMAAVEKVLEEATMNGNVTTFTCQKCSIGIKVILFD